MANVYDEIKRLRNAKSDIRTAVREMGVDIPAEDTIDKYAEYVKSIPRDITVEELTVTANDTYIPPEGVAYAPVNVNVEFTPNLQDMTITVNDTYTCDPGYDGLGTVTVNVTGSGPSYVEAYYGILPHDGFYDEYARWGAEDGNAYCLYNPYAVDNTIDSMYIDGVLQVGLVPYHKFTTPGIHRVKYVFDDNDNRIPDELFNYTRYIYWIDFSHFTGTSIGRQYLERLGNLYMMPNVPTTSVMVSRDSSTSWNMYLPELVTSCNVTNDYRRMYVDFDNSVYASDAMGAVLYNKNNYSVSKMTFQALVPEGVTELHPENFTPEFTANTLPSTLTDFYGFTWEGGYFYFRGVTPPTVYSGGSDNGSYMFVPAQSVSDYETKFYDAGYTSISTHIKPISIADIEFDLNLGEEYAQLSREGGWDGGWMYAIDIYDSLDNLIFSFRPSNSNVLIMKELLGGVDTYKAKLHFVSEYPWGGDYFPGLCYQGHSITKVDLSDVQGSVMGRDYIHNMNNLKTVIVPSNFTNLSENFGRNCPILSEVWLYQTTPPTLSGSSFEVDGGRQTPVTVYVPGASLTDYQSDADWADLESRGLVSIMAMP